MNVNWCLESYNFVGFVAIYLVLCFGRIPIQAILLAKPSQLLKLNSSLCFGRYLMTFMTCRPVHSALRSSANDKRINDPDRCQSPSSSIASLAWSLNSLDCFRCKAFWLAVSRLLLDLVIRSTSTFNTIPHLIHGSQERSQAILRSSSQELNPLVLSSMMQSWIFFRWLVRISPSRRPSWLDGPAEIRCWFSRSISLSRFSISFNSE